MPSVTFGRTETWHSGWRGKQSSTAIRLNGQEVGVIRGEASGLSGMTYRVTDAGHAELRQLPSTYNLRQMKQAVREALA